MTRRFEFVASSSAKYWEVSVAGTDVHICYGRIGTAGQTLTKSFPTSDAAQKHADKLIGEKIGKGYAECTWAG